jgi:hypothetical protein
MDVIDSWEAGKQDWTDDFAAKFKARCGYDCSEPFVSSKNLVEQHASKKYKLVYF